MTRDWFDTQLGKLWILKGVPGDSDAYWEALEDIPEAVFAGAMNHALKTRTWFPTPAEVRADCDVAARALRPAQGVHPTSRLVPVDGARTVSISSPFGGDPITVQVTSDVRRECEACEDSGQVKCWCGDRPSTRWPWFEVRRCERRQPHGDHDYVRPCPCVATNREIQRRKEAQAVKYSQAPEKIA